MQQAGGKTRHAADTARIPNDAVAVPMSEIEAVLLVMSALPPKVDIGRMHREVRFVPKDGVIGRRSCG